MQTIFLRPSKLRITTLFVFWDSLLKLPLSTLQLYMTEEIKQMLTEVDRDGVAKLDRAVYRQATDIIHTQRMCIKPINKMGYPTAADVKAENTNLKPYNQWWKCQRVNKF